MKWMVICKYSEKKNGVWDCPYRVSCGDEPEYRRNPFLRFQERSHCPKDAMADRTGSHTCYQIYDEDLERGK